MINELSFRVQNYEHEIRFTDSRSRCQRQSVRNAKQSRDQSDNDDVVQTKHTIATAATIFQEGASGLNSVAIGTECFGLSESLNTLLYRLTRAVCCRNESA